MKELTSDQKRIIALETMIQEQKQEILELQNIKGSVSDETLIKEAANWGDKYIELRAKVNVAVAYCSEIYFSDNHTEINAYDVLEKVADILGGSLDPSGGTSLICNVKGSIE